MTGAEVEVSFTTRSLAAGRVKAEVIVVVFVLPFPDEGVDFVAPTTLFDVAAADTQDDEADDDEDEDDEAVVADVHVGLFWIGLGIMPSF